MLTGNKLVSAASVRVPGLSDMAAMTIFDHELDRGPAIVLREPEPGLTPAVAAAYAAHWRERLVLSVRFDRREDWCRSSFAAAR
jgi:hypothetical protein